jgi:HEAT repeats
MEIARLALDYVRVLVWPAVLVLGLLLFRGSVRALLSRIATHSEEISATAFGIGISAKLRQVVELVEKSESAEPDELRQSVRTATRNLVIEEFRRISGYFFNAPQSVRVQAADELAGLAPLLGLEKLLDFAASPHPGERIGAAIGLGVYASDSIQAFQDARIVSTLRRLLTDHFSRVRYRAVQAVDGSPELAAVLRPELRRLGDTDPNEFVKEMARKTLARTDRVK